MDRFMGEDQPGSGCHWLGTERTIIAKPYNNVAHATTVSN